MDAEVTALREAADSLANFADGLVSRHLLVFSVETELRERLAVLREALGRVMAEV